MMRGVAALFLLVGPWAALAAEPTPARPPLGRLTLDVGGALGMNLKVSGSTVPTVVSGASPFDAQLSGAWFPVENLGASADLAAHTFQVRGEDLLGERVTTRVTGGAASAAVIGRWMPASFFRLEGGIGYRGLLEMLPPAEAPRDAKAIIAHGLTGQVLLGTALQRFEAAARLRLMLGLGGGVFGARGAAGSAEAGLSLGYAVFETPQTRWSLALDGALSLVSVSGSSTYSGSSLRMGIGLAFAWLPPLPPVAQEAPVKESERRTDDATATVQVEAREAGPGRLRGTVLGPQSAAPIAGAEVALSTGPHAVTDESGAFVLEPAGPGPVTVSVKASGFLPAEDIVQIPPGGEVDHTFVLAKEKDLTPATLRGLIRTASGRSAAISVKIVGLAKRIQLSAEGRFVTQVPAGTWEIIISAPRHVTQNKVVTVAPGDQALLHCDLQPVNQ